MIYFKKRKYDELNERKFKFAKDAQSMKDLVEIIDYVKPSVLIGIFFR